jgi:hypothetical protein
MGEGYVVGLENRLFVFVAQDSLVMASRAWVYAIIEEQAMMR